MRRLEVAGLSHDGRGLARVDGKVAFVAGALAGETVEAVPLRRHARFDEYRLVAVVAPAADRVPPPCPLFGRCGGCDLQHLAADAQLRHKSGVVLDLLERQAGLTPGRLEAPIRSAPFGYRRRARLALFVPRRGAAPVLGFRESGGRRIVAVEQCAVLHPALAALPGRLQQVLGRLRQPRAIGHLELMVSESAGAADCALIHVHAMAALAQDDEALLAQLAEREGAYLSVRTPAGPSLLQRPGAEEPGYRLPAFALRIGYAPGDFLQGNAEVNQQLVARVAAWLQAGPGQRVLDAFAGIGNFSLPLGRSGADVLGLEGAVALVERARANARAHLLDNVTFLVRDLTAELRLPGRDALDAVLLDPPRAGARQLVDWLIGRRVPTVLYVSCAPATLARDAAALASAGYGLARLALVDMFPQTAHVETMALFVRGAR